MNPWLPQIYAAAGTAGELEQKAGQAEPDAVADWLLR